MRIVGVSPVSCPSVAMTHKCLQLSIAVSELEQVGAVHCKEGIASGTSATQRLYYRQGMECGVHMYCIHVAKDHCHISW